MVHSGRLSKTRRCAIIHVVNETTNNPQPDSNRPGDKPNQEDVTYSSVAARVPEKVAKGIFCTGQVILDSPKEFVFDFLQGLTRPFQVAQRVVMTPATVNELSHALQKNLEMYSEKYGPPPPPPGPVPDRWPSIQEIYENFRLPDDMLSGIYANSVMIGHSPPNSFSTSSPIFTPHRQWRREFICPANRCRAF